MKGLLTVAKKIAAVLVIALCMLIIALFGLNHCFRAIDKNRDVGIIEYWLFYTKSAPK
jgi:hypothetical protein